MRKIENKFLIRFFLPSQFNNIVVAFTFVAASQNNGFAGRIEPFP
jgi:hypothetical protein